MVWRAGKRRHLLVSPLKAAKIHQTRTSLVQQTYQESFHGQRRRGRLVWKPLQVWVTSGHSGHNDNRAVGASAVKQKHPLVWERTLVQKMTSDCVDCHCRAALQPHTDSVPGHEVESMQAATSGQAVQTLKKRKHKQRGMVTESWCNTHIYEMPDTA